MTSDVCSIPTAPLQKLCAVWQHCLTLSVVDLFYDIITLTCLPDHRWFQELAAQVGSPFTKELLSSDPLMVPHWSSRPVPMAHAAARRMASHLITHPKPMNLQTPTSAVMLGILGSMARSRVTPRATTTHSRTAELTGLAMQDLLSTVAVLFQAQGSPAAPRCL